MKIIFENEDFIILNKPAGLLSLPARGTLALEESVYTLMKKKYGEIYIVHRLDKETSGLMAIARKRESHSLLCRIFENRMAEKKYIALVYGKVQGEEGRIEKRIKEFSSGRCGVDFDGKDSITLYKVIEKSERFSLLELDLLTGRRHQIRVHLYSIGHPVVGDTFYGDIKEQRKYPRLMLHSYKLSFEYKTQKYSFMSKPDEEFYEIVNLLL